MVQSAIAFLPVRVARWLLPWLSVLAFSSSLAFAANLALAGTWSQQAARPNLPPPDARWVSIALTSREGARLGVRCLARPGFFTGDIVTIDVQDFDSVAADICLEIDARGST